MNNIIKEIHYCIRHANYARISIYAGDEITYSLSCPICYDELTNLSTVSSTKKVTEPRKQTHSSSRNS